MLTCNGRIRKKNLQNKQRKTQARILLLLLLLLLYLVTQCCLFASFGFLKHNQTYNATQSTHHFISIVPKNIKKNVQSQGTTNHMCNKPEERESERVPEKYMVQKRVQPDFNP